MIDNKLEDKFIKLYCFEQRKYEEIENELNISREIIRQLYNLTREKRKVIQSIKNKFFKNRKNGFDKDFERFYNWYIKQPQKCHYCDITQDELTEIFRKGKGVLPYSTNSGFIKRAYGTLEIERLDTNFGYVEGNIALACPLCNNAKSNLISEEDYIRFFKAPMKKYLDSLIEKL